MNRISFGYRFLITTSSILAILLLASQTLALIDYDLAISLGLQETVDEISEMGIVWAKGFAFGDTVIYLPLLIIGIIGVLKRKKWGLFSLFGSMAISVYWPLVHLHAIYYGHSVFNLSPEKYVTFFVLLPLIVIYGLWGMWFLYRNRDIYFA